MKLKTQKRFYKFLFIHIRYQILPRLFVECLNFDMDHSQLVGLTSLLYRLNPIKEADEIQNTCMYYSNGIVEHKIYYTNVQFSILSL